MAKLPQAFINASATTSEHRAKLEAKSKLQSSVDAAPFPAKVTARIDMSAEVAGAGLCPECKQPMTKSHANGIPVLMCDAHRIAIPMPD